MLECEDIQSKETGHGRRTEALTISFRDEEGEDVCAQIHMMERAAVDMARWIMQNWGHKYYMTLEEARQKLMEEGADAL